MPEFGTALGQNPPTTISQIKQALIYIHEAC